MPRTLATGTLLPGAGNPIIDAFVIYSRPMGEAVTKQLLQIGMVILFGAFVFLVCKIRRLPIRRTLGLTIPSGRSFLFWIGCYMPIFVAAEILFFGMGLHHGRVWEYEGFVTILRIVKLAIAGPIVEELVFRGLMFGAIQSTRLGPIWALIITTVFFSCAHFSYQPGDLAIILVEAFYWGLVRYKTGSIAIPIILHVFGNSMSIVEYLYLNKVIP